MSAGSLDIALELLRGHRLPYKCSERDLRVWEAVCPACRVPGWTLRIREPVKGGSIALLCRSGCDGQAIREALEREPVHPRIEELEHDRDELLSIAEAARETAARALALLAEGRLPEAVAA